MLQLAGADFVGMGKGSGCSAKLYMPAAWAQNRTCAFEHRKTATRQDTHTHRQGSRTNKVHNQEKHTLTQQLTYQHQKNKQQQNIRPKQLQIRITHAEAYAHTYIYTHIDIHIHIHTFTDTLLQNLLCSVAACA